jgi:hypothetical protein
MLPFQLEGGLVMVKLSGRPVNSIVASLAVCAAGFFKLPVMDILVTAGTV